MNLKKGVVLKCHCPVCGQQSGQECDTQSDTQFTIVADITDKVLKYCEEPRTEKEIRDYLNISSKRYVAYNIIKPLINMGIY